MKPDIAYLEGGAC